MKTECGQNRFKQAHNKSFRSIKLEQFIKLRPTSCSAPTYSRLKCCQTSARRRMQKVGISKKLQTRTLQFCSPVVVELMNKLTAEV